MKDKVIEAMNKISENIKILPHKTKADKVKYLNYLDENISSYTNLSNDVYFELVKRYHLICSTKENAKIKELMNQELDVKSIRLLDKNIDIYDAIEFDILFYKLSKYYKDDLDNANRIILEIIRIFKKYGTNLKIEDFNYTNYVNEYMKVLLSNYNNKTLIHNTFYSIYWKCPNLFKEIEMNFKYLFLKNKKVLILNVRKINNNTTNILNKYFTNKNELRSIIKKDYAYYVNNFLNKNFNINDFKDTNIIKIKQSLLENDNDNYDNLLKLSDNLNEYNLYLKYKYIIDNMNELIKSKESYKGLKDAKLKEIKKMEAQLFKDNKKINNHGLFKISENKKVNIITMEEELIKNIIVLYDELNDLLIKDNIFSNVNNASTIKDLLFIASNNYFYFVKLLKEQDDKVTIETINNKLQELRNDLLTININILNNVK